MARPSTVARRSSSTCAYSRSVLWVNCTRVCSTDSAAAVSDSPPRSATSSIKGRSPNSACRSSRPASFARCRVSSSGGGGGRRAMASRAPRIASCRLRRDRSGGVSSLSRRRRSGKTRRACLEANLFQVHVSTSSRPSRCSNDSVSRRKPSLGTMQAARKRSLPARRSARSRCTATVVFPQPASPRISTVSRGGSSTTARWTASSSTSTGEAGRAR